MRYSPKEMHPRADEIYVKIKDRVDLRGNEGKFVAIDVESGEYEVDDGRIEAVDRLFRA